MLVSAAIEPYRKPLGKARSRSATIAGSWSSARSTASPRYTWVPGVHACAMPGSSAIITSARAARPPSRASNLSVPSDAQPLPLPAERTTEVSQLRTDEAVDALACFVDRFRHVLFDLLGGD